MKKVVSECWPNNRRPLHMLRESVSIFTNRSCRSLKSSLQQYFIKNYERTLVTIRLRFARCKGIKKWNTKKFLVLCNPLIYIRL
jgi:hypothetical protein